MTAIQLNSELFFTLGKISSDEGLMKKLLKYAKKLAATKEDETLVSKEEFIEITSNYQMPVKDWKKLGGCAFFFIDEEGKVIKEA